MASGVVIESRPRQGVVVGCYRSGSRKVLCVRAISFCAASNTAVFVPCVTNWVRDVLEAGPSIPVEILGLSVCRLPVTSDRGA